MVQARKIPDVSSIVLAAFAAVLYSSWPLGNVLDPIANRGLASNLSALGRPYNWVFALFDVAAGAVVLAVAVRLFSRTPHWRRSLVSWSIISYGLFGVLTALDAVLPLDCVDVVRGCGALSNHPLTILHGLVSLGSIGCLTMSIVGFWYVLGFNRNTPRWLRGLLLSIVVCWFGFGIATGIFLFYSRSSALSQHLFIVVCSLWIAGLPYLVAQVAGGLAREKVTVR